jgi:hypothetical protein
VHVNVNAVDAASAPVVPVPLTGRAPVQPPEAVQLVALVVVQARIEFSPATIAVGLALRARVGAGGGAATTVTLTVWLVEPPLPVQVSVYAEVTVSGPVVTVPAVPRSPLQAPEAVQAVASLDVQVSVDAWPEVTVGGLAERLTTGAPGLVDLTTTATVRAALPPGPAQVSVKSLEAESAALASLPLSGLLPLQAPEAVQPVASLALHTRLVADPLGISVGWAVRATMGAACPLPSAESPPEPHPQVRSALSRAAIRVRMPAIFSTESVALL